MSLKLKEALGSEAGDELIGIVDKAASDISDLRGDLAELRHQTALGFARVDAQFAAFGERLEKQTNRLVLWSFGFWATTLATVSRFDNPGSKETGQRPAASPNADPHYPY